MLRREKVSIVFFLTLWCTLVIALILHASSFFNLKIFHFPSPTGNLILLQEGYKNYNLLGLREEIYAVPQGVPFLHVKRVADMQRGGTYIAYSLQDARRMVDAGTSHIPDALVLAEKDVQGFNLYRSQQRYVAVPAMDKVYGTPLPVGKAYEEVDVGSQLDEAKAALLKSKNATN